jgi:hypothetical protein
MITFLAALISFFAGYRMANKVWSSSARNYRRVDFDGGSYRVLRDDDPIFFVPDNDSDSVRQLCEIIRRHGNPIDHY